MNSSKNFILTLFRNVISDVTEEVDIQEAVAVATIFLNSALGTGLGDMNDSLDRATTEVEKLTARKFVDIFKKLIEVINEITLDDVLVAYTTTDEKASTDSSTASDTYPPADDSAEPVAKRPRLIDDSQEANENDDQDKYDAEDEYDSEDDDSEDEDDNSDNDNDNDNNDNENKTNRKLASFSKETLNTVKQVYGCYPESYKALEVFSLRPSGSHGIDMKSVFEKVDDTIEASRQDVRKMLETSRYPLIAPVLNAMARAKGVEHWAQYPMKNGMIAQGYPDWAFIYKDLPIFIVEGKKKITTSGVAQVVLQLYEAYMKMETRGTADKPWTMYGMVTTATRVVFIKALFCEGRCIKVLWNGKIFRIPHRKKMRAIRYIKRMLPVIGCMGTILDEQMQQLDNTHSV
jgi:hypothetical protein